MNIETNVVIWKNTGPSGALSIHVLNTDGFNTFNYTATSSNIYIQIRQAGTYYLDNIRMYRTYEDTIFVSGYKMDMAYRYGFNGMEKDDNIKGEGNSYTTEFRQYDPRVGRWLSIDPLFADFPWQSPYVAFDNNPIYYKDPKGLAAEWNDNGDGTYTAEEGDSAGSLAKDAGIPFEAANKIVQQQLGENYRDKDGNINSNVEDVVNLSNYYRNNEEQNEVPTSSLTFNLTLATGSVLINEGVKMTEAIVNSRSGITSGKLNPNSARVYNKSKAKLTGNILKGTGHTLTGVSIVLSEVDYQKGDISKARRDYNRLNAGTVTIFPVAGIPIVAGDYFGQKYHPQIEHQVMEGVLNKSIRFILDLFGLQTTPYPRNSEAEKKFIENKYNQ